MIAATTRVVAILAAGIVSGCGGTDRPEPASSRMSPLGADDVRRGMLVLGHEVRSFVPCEESDEAWVVDRTPDAELEQAYRELAGGAPYQAVFVEVRAEYGPPPAEGFGAAYARQLTVHELRRAALEGPGCSEDPSEFELRAMGNEPSWSVKIAKSGILLSRLDGPSPRVLPYAAPRSSSGGTIYSATSELPHVELVLELRRERCTDTMSGARFSHAARALLDGKELIGCAYEGSPPSRGSVMYSMRTVEQKLAGCGSDGSETCAWFRFDYPEIHGGLAPAPRNAIAAEIEAFIRAPLAQEREPASPEQLIERWTRDYREFRERFPDSAQGRRIERTVSVLAVAPTFVSLSMREASYQGGAHANERVALASFDARSGRRIVLNEILREGAREELTRLAEAEFRRSKGLGSDTPLADAGYWFEEGRFALNDNFALTAKGLRFRFDAYEIAPYSMGPTSLDLPRTVVAPLLRDQEKGRLDHEAPIESLDE